MGIYREEVLVMMGVLGDIQFDVCRVRAILEDEDDEEEEEMDS